MLDHMKQVAKEQGLPFGDRKMTFNSRLAQELGKWAEQMEKGDAFHDAVFRAYFADGRNIADANVLADIATTGRFIGQSAVCVAVFCKDTKYYLEDGCAATENILVAAAALGVGSCWVAGDKKPYCSQINQMLGVPPEFKLVSLISLGYPKGEVKPHKKRDLKEVLHREKF